MPTPSPDIEESPKVPVAPDRHRQQHHAGPVKSPVSEARRRVLWKIGILAIVFLPAIVTGIGIANNAVNIPVWDDWERGPLLERYYNGTLDFAFLNSAHIDHRMLVPRLLILASNALTGGNLLFEIWLSYLIYTGGAVALFCLLRKTFGDTAWMWGTALLVNVVYFSPVQYQNFLWAVQIAMLLPFACLGVILFTMRTELSAGWKFAICSVTAWAGMHSFGHGILLWPVAIGLAAGLFNLGTIRRRLWLAGGLAATAALAISLYFFWDYTNTSIHAYGQMPGETPPGVVSAEKGIPDKFFRMSLITFGSALSRLFPNTTDMALSMGRLCLLGFAGSAIGCVLLAWRRRSRESWDAAWSWIVAGGFSIMTVAAIVLGRGHRGNIDKGLLSRYAGAPMFLTIAAIVLVSLLLIHWRRQAKTPAAREMRTRVALVVAVIWIGIQFPIWMHGMTKMTHWKLARGQQRASLLYINHFEPKHFRRQDYDLDFARTHANLLDDHGLLNPPLFEKPDFGSFLFDPDPLERRRSEVIEARVNDEGELDIWGFATIRGPDRIADGVLLACRRVGQEDWKVVTLAEMEPLYIDQRTFLDTQFGSNRNLDKKRNYAGWSGSIPLTDLPSGDFELGLWAVDALEMRLQRIDRTLQIKSDRLEPGEQIFREEG